jgi:hypothetical protein
MKKKASALAPVNKSVVAGGNPDATTGEVRRVEAAEVEERGSFGQRKAHQGWLGHAIDPLTGVGLASVVGSRAEEGCGELQKLLKPVGLVQCYTDAAGV